MSFWQLGNTSVRSALRIRDGLVALSKSTIQGNIRGADGDIAFRNLLGQCGVVSLGEDQTNSLGRKWRSAMGKLGFIYPEIDDQMGFSQCDLGKLDFITPAGWNLISANTVASIQECYLRSMVTPVVPTGNGTTFSPLCWTLAILLELEKRHYEPFISFIEMAVVVQTTTPADGIDNVVTKLLQLRDERNHADHKRVFDRKLYEQKATEIGKVAHTFRDYADMNIRYLKATGVVQAKGKGIAIVPEKHMLAIQLTAVLETSEPLLNTYRKLCDGSELPTDHAGIAIEVLNDLLLQAKKYGIDYSFEGKKLETPTQINKVRYELEELISEKKEELYALAQVSQWREIAAYMNMIVTKRHSYTINEDTTYSIPKAEMPAYLEWCLWRAFLALDNLTNKPYNVRRFNIDQDFMPVSTAPGNGPDLIAEFEDRIVVIEVTLSESSRQEAMEGEPVRRHVADIMQTCDKPVYGLFIANRIDSNTAETFRIGVWYTHDDEQLSLNIVPITLEQFLCFFKALFETGNVTPDYLFSLMKQCSKFRNFDAPQWKNYINQIVEMNIKAMMKGEPIVI